MPSIEILSSEPTRLVKELDNLISLRFGQADPEKRWDGSIKLSEPEVDPAFLERVRKAIPDVKVSDDVKSRFWCSIGKSAYEILQLRSGEQLAIVPCVAFPKEKDLKDLLPSLKKAGINALIHGGGTGVTGGLRRNGLEKRVAIDCKELKSIDVKRNYVIVGPGVRGSNLEETLNQKERTVGHFPESLRDSSVGGWIAAKSSGQESNEYGDIEDMVMSLDLYRSDFSIQDTVVPRESSGISAKYIAIGGEGLTGLVGNVALKTHPIPNRRIYKSYAFRDFRLAVDFLSDMEKFPTVVRVSDEEETRFLVASAGESRGKDVLKKYISVRSLNPENFSLMICVDNERKTWQVPPPAVSLGASLSRIWEKSRYGRPEIGDEMWRRGYVPDTLETAAKWDDLLSLYDSAISVFREKTRELELKGILMAHISHLYSTGGAIYFTFILDQNTTTDGLMAVRSAMVESFMSNGGSITHHHGIGTYLAKYLPEGETKILDLLQDPVLADHNE